MPASATSTALVIAGRYLASPAALRTRPEGPIEALDTRSGRTAQVRIVFASDGWEDEAFTEAVSRWCALACSEICGVLDFGEHEGRRFLVVPPSLGMTVERWQATRRPGAADAAALTLAFGRLAERIAAAGFPVDACDLADCAVGPGPTPFIERPLLGSPLVNDVLVGPRDGQRTLASVLRAAGSGPLPEPLAAWLERAERAGFASLAECLDDLERCGNDVRSSDPTGDLLGLDGLFDEDDEAFEARFLSPEPRRWPRRVLGGAGALALAVLAFAALGHRQPGALDAAVRPAAPRPVAVAEAPPHADAKPRRHHAHRRPHPHARRTQRPSHRHATRPDTPPPPPSPPAATPTRASSGSGTALPDPGSVATLPPP
ncbi:MAG TPA: hypothetical protein VGC71_08790 [Gaiellales bacterium]|jgi:hypothetical protein